MPGSANFHLKHIICPRQFNTQRDSRVSLTTPTSQNILQILAGFLLNQVFRANKAVCYYNTMHYAQMIICKKMLVEEKKPPDYAVFYPMKRNISANYTLIQIRKSSCFLSCFSISISCPRSNLAWSHAASTSCILETSVKSIALPICGRSKKGQNNKRIMCHECVNSVTHGQTHPKR